MIEILTLFSFLVILWLVLVSKDALLAWRIKRRRRFMDAMVGRLEGQDLQQAFQLLGYPREMETGSGGTQMCVWKDPEETAIPETPELLIVTIVADAAGTITKAGWETR